MMCTTLRRPALLRHPAWVIGAWASTRDAAARARNASARARTAAAAGRGPEHRVAALTLAALLFMGGLMGTANLFVDGMIHGGVQRWLYGGTMGLCMLA